MARISEILAKAQNDPILLMDLFNNVEAALSKHNLTVSGDSNSGDLHDLKVTIIKIKADLAAQLTHFQVIYAEEGRVNGVVGIGI